MILTIIVTCFNHENYLEEAINSAIHQKIQEKQIIVIDNGSEDSSRELLERIKETHPFIELILPDKKLNYCQAFNLAYKKAKGQFIIDLSGDDVLTPEFALKALAESNSLSAEYGVFYSNVEYIDNQGKHLKFHFGKKGDSKYQFPPPSGFIYKELLAKHIISSPGMIFKKEVLNDLGGYDESLYYEDFDFWLRSSRNWKYKYLDSIGVKVRRHGGNLGSNFYKKNQKEMMWSTFKVCLKAKELNRTDEENMALHKRCSYHMRHAVLTEHFRLGKKYYALIKSIGKPFIIDRIFLGLALLQWPVYPFYKMYINDHR
ncbi:MAG: glycosyltransferase [Cytophagales bacterium]